MRRLRMLDNDDQPSDIVILVRVSDVYSEDLLSVALFVDPWRLFDSNELAFEGDWIVEGALEGDSSASNRKRHRIYEPSMKWSSPRISQIYQDRLDVGYRRKDKHTYNHQALKAGRIRLLYLLPGDTEDRLQGVIIHVPYNSAGTYRAFSYVWGTNQSMQELVTPDGILEITFSLSKALQSLRHKNTATMLWVDAICIDQNDNQEKARQIRLLPQIFQSATSTYAFLESGNANDAAIEMLMQVQAKALCDRHCADLERNRLDSADLAQENNTKGRFEARESTKENILMDSEEDTYSTGWQHELAKLPSSWEDRCMPSLDEPIWTSVKALFDLPWFRRVWIIQEIVGAPHVKIVCGKWTIDWSDLHAAVEIIGHEVELADGDFSGLKASWAPFLSLAALREWEARQYR
jgi:hypothetical protein